VVKKILSKTELTFEPVVTAEIITDIREKIYKSFIIYIDANDNGVDLVHDKEFLHVPSTLWSRVSRLNPMWWEEDVD
jgi:uncharacterized UPF0160 family protein